MNKLFIIEDNCTTFSDMVRQIDQFYKDKKIEVEIEILQLVLPNLQDQEKTHFNDLYSGLHNVKQTLITRGSISQENYDAISKDAFTEIKKHIDEKASSEIGLYVDLFLLERDDEEDLEIEEKRLHDKQEILSHKFTDKAFLPKTRFYTTYKGDGNRQIDGWCELAPDAKVNNHLRIDAGRLKSDLEFFAELFLLSSGDEK